MYQRIFWLHDGVIFGLSCAILGLSWAILRPSWGHVGVMLSRFGALPFFTFPDPAVLGPSQGFAGHVMVILGSLGAILKLFESVLVSVSFVLAHPGGVDDIVNYEVFGTSFYLGHLLVSLVILGPS